MWQQPSQNSTLLDSTILSWLKFSSRTKQTQVEEKVLPLLVDLHLLHLEVGQVHLLPLQYLRGRQGKDFRIGSPSSGGYGDGDEEHLDELHIIYSTYSCSNVTKHCFSIFMLAKGWISSTGMIKRNHVGTVLFQASPTSLPSSSRTGSRWREARFCSSSSSSSSDCYLDLFLIQYLSNSPKISTNTETTMLSLGAVHLHLPPARHPHVPHLHLRRDRPGRPTHWCSQLWDKLHRRQP